MLRCMRIALLYIGQTFVATRALQVGDGVGLYQNITSSNFQFKLLQKAQNQEFKNQNSAKQVKLFKHFYCNYQKIIFLQFLSFQRLKNKNILLLIHHRELIESGASIQQCKIHVALGKYLLMNKLISQIYVVFMGCSIKLVA